MFDFNLLTFFQYLSYQSVVAVKQTNIFKIKIRTIFVNSKALFNVLTFWVLWDVNKLQLNNNNDTFYALTFWLIS